MSDTERKDNPFRYIPERWWGLKSAALEDIANAGHAGIVFDDRIIWDLTIEKNMWVFIECAQ